jgi:hypothetical protein
MKKPNNNLILSLLICFIAISAHAQNGDKTLIRCVTDELDSASMSRDPFLNLLRQKSEAAIEKHVAQRKRMRIAADQIVTIPVVVHVVHNQKDGQTGGRNNYNISDEQVQSQIDVLNEDYGNRSGYKGFYTDSLGVDTGIRFKLVGIVRKYDSQKEFNPIKDEKLLADISPPWPTDRYLNIWVCNLTDLYLGVAQFPVISEVNDQTVGLDQIGKDEISALTDGVIIDGLFFGRNSEGLASSVYNLGRTATHEIGHWLGLFHTWGNSICGTDYCDDTPRTETKNETTLTTCAPKFSFCEGTRSRNMIENYMDYSPDVCMSVFTADQKDRMQAVLALSPRRAKLVEFSKRTGPAVTVEIYPNPVSEFLNASVFTPDYKPFSVSIYNSRGMRMTSDMSNKSYINVKNYPAGLYYLKVSTDAEIITKRFMVR